MKKQFRTSLLEFTEENLGNKFGDLTEKQHSVWMARFFAEKIIRPLNPALVPDVDEDLEACAVDGADDCGVDFISRAGNTVLIVQAKYSGARKKASRAYDSNADVDYFRAVLNRLADSPSKYQMNAKLREVVADIDWERDSFDLRYITLRQLPENSIVSAQDGIDTNSEYPDLDDRASLDLLGETQLNEALRDALTAQSGVPESVELLFSSNGTEPPYLLLGGPRKALIGRLSGSQLAGLFRRYKSSLFALNLRNYIGDNATNKGIRETASSDPDDFFFFNNGLSALASDIELDASDPLKVRCKRFSIINGAQTVRSLSKAQANDRDSLREVQVLIRLSEVSPRMTPEEQRFLDSVTKLNNTQNTIKVSDFRSNDAVQQDLNAKFAQLKARSGKKFRYKNKRTGDPDRTKIAVGMEEFTKTVFSFLYGPPDMFGGTSYLFDPGKDGGYSKLYGDELGSIKLQLSRDEFKLYTGIWFVAEYVRDVWKTESRSDETGALERRWLVYYTVGEAARMMYTHLKCDLDEDLRALADPGWNDPKTSSGEKTKAAISQYSKLSFQCLRRCYEAASGKSGFRYRNWFRREETMADIRVQLEDYGALLKDDPKYRLCRDVR